MSDQDVNTIIGKITTKLLLILIPTMLISVGSTFMYDHFMLKNKVDRLEFYQGQAELILMVEQKTRAIESLAKSNSQTASNNKELINKIEKSQVTIDEYLRKEFRTRGLVQELPKY